MLFNRVVVCLAPFVVAMSTMSAVAQLETDPLPPDPPIDLGGTISIPDSILAETPIEPASSNYSRAMRARQISNKEPALRTRVTVQPTLDAPPTLEFWNTASAPAQMSSPAKKRDGRVSPTSYDASYEMSAPTIPNVSNASGFGDSIAHPTSISTSQGAAQPYIPQVEHIPVVYEAAGIPSVSQPVQTASYGVSSCDSYSGCSCGGAGCLGGGGGIFGSCLAGYGQANALPLGAASNAYFDQQVYNGERSRYTVYNYDFSDLGSADPSQLNRAGRSKLAKLVTPSGARSFVAHQIIVQPVLDDPLLSQARRAAVLQFLTSRLGVDYGDGQVVLAEPDYRGLRGVEAIEIDRNQLQNTRSFGALGAGNQLGGQGGGQGGSQIGRGSQTGQRR